MLIGLVGLAFLIAGLILLLITFIFKAGSGVPAGMIMIPATLCVPWAIFITELVNLSEWIGKRKGRKT